MTTERKSFFWVSGLIVFLILVFFLREVLLPFVAGMAIAYFLDPVCDWLEEHGFSRTTATTIVTIVFFFIFILILAIILPAAFQEIRDFTERAPKYIENIRLKLAPLIAFLQEQLAGQDIKSLLDKAFGASGTVFKGVGQVTGQLLTGVGAIVSAISLAVLTPIVTFYLLRDWDLIVAKVDGWLPRCHLETIRGIFREIDQTLSGFARGQILVCLMLGSFYAVGLAVVGLEFGLIIGFFTGLISFVPYFGMLIGFALGMGVAIAQFDQASSIAIVAAVFGIGQILEGYVLTPRMIGDRVGLHPVWIIFALMAGGALFGFLGVLLAVPVTAVIGVLARFSLRKYMSSPLFDPTLKKLATASTSSDLKKEETE